MSECAVEQCTICGDDVKESDAANAIGGAAHPECETRLTEATDAFADAYTSFVSRADDAGDACETVNRYLFDRFAAGHIGGYQFPAASDGFADLATLPIGFDELLTPAAIGFRFDEIAGRLHGRGKTGSFYTPEYVVEYIHENTILPSARSRLDDWGIDVSGVAETTHSDEDYDPLTPEALATACTPEQAESVLGRFSEFSVCDPACGSGQFLVAAAEEIAAITMALAERADRGHPYPSHVWRACTQNIYGVDLIDETVRMARLRLRLKTLETLPVTASHTDVETIRDSRLLEWQIKQGNSLIGSTLEDLTNSKSSASERETETGQATLSDGGWK